MKQNDCLTIKGYCEDVKDTCGKIAICGNWNKQITDSTVNEFFYNNLTKRTQLEMSRLNMKTTGEMYVIIHKTKNTMIEQMKTQKRFAKKNDFI